MTTVGTPRLITHTAAELTALLVPAGQPWCENSLDGPARPPEETRAARFIEPFLAELGFDTRLVGRTETRANLVAAKVFGPGPTLLLNDHLDTYPAGPPSRWTKCADPFAPVVEDGRVYARGTSDTRGNLATLLRAVAEVCADPPESGTLTVALTADEERNGVEGALYLLEEHGLTADAAITVEPTAWTEGGATGVAIATSHTGHALLDLAVHGRSSHIWRPDTGVNAAHLLLEVLSALRDLPDGWGASTVGLDAGEPGMAQFTPLRASARVAIVGLGPDVTKALVLQRVTDIARDLTGVTATVDVRFAPGPTFVPGTVALDADEPIVAALRDSYTDHDPSPARLYAKPAYCDTIRFRHAGIPAVTFGPGDDGWAVYDESISVAGMEFAARVLAGAIRRFLRR
ncbi:M20/M25/M40 family metallo-hydrolase [Nocardia puris]|uniref:Acetylornithine deacetylase n=1 Tax=Nocardia puris TaxID=208602 RepID=A0A366DH91_9NOCA|nr:M20/M25/M40 family metallo-hydrolase [Nocardia puris]MBF6213270.1 M20/M25/M40 family metallo-hydrolase [Nocardia puris]MBF6369862.1 M20/M25/M40 family metallo-hydrolase [Nocardia puris]MBF6462149.1 M20/M25/M40 family metallo-hydrolase [Nocardia puris]RBO89452.1 acetylornithine deacetylase [Nocardia puris]